MSLLTQDLPSVGQILQDPILERLLERYERDFVVEQVRGVLDEWRQQIRHGKVDLDANELEERVVSQVGARVDGLERPSLRHAVNATGVILHSGLGRAPLPAVAGQSLAEVVVGYCNLEIDLELGERGSRFIHVEELICLLAGSESALVVNNNAAAVLLVLHNLARGREVLVSRGELIEIGGSFRIPEIITSSGARIREVGTTNRTHLDDFAHAVNQETAMILVVHPSNYQVKGFTAAVSLADLVELGQQAKVPVVHDLGGGVLVDLKTWGLPVEPLVSDSLDAGVDLVTFSGDKILGGPQAGLIVGSRSRIDQLRRDPLMRALRCDKLTLAALEATLRLFLLAPAKLREQHPVLTMMCSPLEVVEARGETLLDMMPAAVTKLLSPQLESSAAQVGSGALPLEEIPSIAVTLSPDYCSCEDLAQLLRTRQRPVVGRIQRGKLMLDMRTVDDSELSLISDALSDIVASVQ